MQAYELVTAERLDKLIHIATYIEVVGTVIVILAYHAHARDTSKLFRRHGVAELYRHPLPCLLTQRFYLFNGHEFALTNDSHAVAYLLHVAHDVRTHENGLSPRLLFQQKFIENFLQQRIKAGSRLVQDQHLGVAHERQHDTDLLPHSLGIPFYSPLHPYLQPSHHSLHNHRLPTFQAAKILVDLLSRP